MSDPLYVDELQLYVGRDFQVNDYIKIHIPRVGEIVDYGEKEYYQMIYSLTSIPSDMKSMLADSGIDYEEISDFELFFMLTRSLDAEKTKILFYDLDLSKMQLFKDETNGKFVMYDADNDIKLDELSYLRLVKCLRTLHSITPKVEKAANKTTKKILIQLDRERVQKQKDTNYESTLKPLISAMMRYPGFKYKTSELMDCTIYEFMDTVIGAQIYVSSTTLLQGSYSGMCDTSKINKKEFNWLRGINE